MIPKKIEFQSIEWHCENIRNREIHLAKAQEYLITFKKRVERDLEELDFYKSQVRSAVDQGKLKFDADKFGKKRGPKS
jgi:hypothetical protein